MYLSLIQAQKQIEQAEAEREKLLRDRAQISVVKNSTIKMQEVPWLPCDISHSFILTVCILLQSLHEQMTSLRAELYKVRQTHTYIHTHMHAYTHAHTLHIDSLIDQTSETGN